MFWPIRHCVLILPNQDGAYNEPCNSEVRFKVIMVQITTYKLHNKCKLYYRYYNTLPTFTPRVEENINVVLLFKSINFYSCFVLLNYVEFQFPFSDGTCCRRHYLDVYCIVSRGFQIASPLFWDVLIRQYQLDMRTLSLAWFFTYLTSTECKLIQYLKWWLLYKFLISYRLVQCTWRILKFGFHFKLYFKT